MVFLSTKKGISTRPTLISGELYYTLTYKTLPGPSPIYVISLQALEGLIDVNRLTHRLLSEYMDLDDFDAMLEEANNSVTVPCGRIPLYIFLELNNDFLLHYCYNSATDRCALLSLLVVPTER